MASQKTVWENRERALVIVLLLLLLPHSYLWIMCKQGKIRFFISKSSWKRHLLDGPRRTTAWLVYLLLIWTFSFLRDHFIYTRCSKKSRIFCLYIWFAISESIRLYIHSRNSMQKRYLYITCPKTIISNAKRSACSRVQLGMQFWWYDNAMSE